MAAGDHDLAGVRVVRPGSFDPAYSRNRIIAKALQRAGAEVDDIPLGERFPRRVRKVVRATRRAHADVVMVPFAAHGDVPVVRAAVARRHTPVVFDPLVSLTETMVDDRRLVPEHGPRAWRYRFEDRLSLGLADVVLVDTHAHAAYYAAAFGLDPAKARRVWVGADDEVMVPRPRREDGPFRVFLYATFIPLHGIEHVVDAAAALERAGEAVEFVVAGDGQTFTAQRARAERAGVGSLRFLGRRPYRELPQRIADADVCLGVFGTSGKAQRVVPNKVFDGLACRRAVVTGDTPAAREALTHGVDAWLVPAGDAEALADAVVQLRDHPDVRERLARAGYERFRACYSIDAISRDLAPVVLASISMNSSGSPTPKRVVR